ncbi:MAG TPA: FAD-binding protein [Acidimicrobiia bacterium]|nr:FAD-binding protein [Acidimicrobiia bacterium]
MDLITLDAEPVRAAFADAGAVVPVGARTHWEVGGPPPQGREVAAPAGVVAYDPADLTVTVGAGTPVDALDRALAEHGQHCPLDPRDPGATVGGVLATGLSGRRRLRYGPVRDQVLEVRLVTPAGRLVKGGGPTVKNVTGYDLPRLVVGSFGTLGVLVQVTLRCWPRPRAARWGTTTSDPSTVRAALFRPSAIVWDGHATSVLVEGEPADVDAELRAGALAPAEAPPFPHGAHRGRVSVPSAALVALASDLDAIHGCRWAAEVGVGTVHVAGDSADVLRDTRAAAHARGGWMLREAGGAPDDDGFGVPVPNPQLHARLRDAFDPDRRCNPGRVPW